MIERQIHKESQKYRITDMEIEYQQYRTGDRRGGRF